MNRKILIGDNRETLKTLADNSVDSIVTDPPYELGFKGAKWDSSGIAYDQSLWTECLRVLKPGGHLLAFSGSRTYHRMVVAIEDAGFDIRDQIMWVYGAGFPKSWDVSKAVDRHLGGERRIGGQKSGAKNVMRPTPVGWDGKITITAPATPEAKKWDGWGTALKPAHEPICVARKPLIWTVAENVLEHGTGGINVDGCRVGTEERVILVPSCFFNRGGGIPGGQGAPNCGAHTVAGRWPANFIHDGSEEVLAQFPKDNVAAARFFYWAKVTKDDREAGLDGFDGTLCGMSGGAAAAARGETYGKPGEGWNQTKVRKNHHPTVKPCDLMRYLCRLVTPPGGLVLDPFAGSGSTGKAATIEGFRFIGCELSPEYAAIAEARIAAATHSIENAPENKTRENKEKHQQLELL